MHVPPGATYCVPGYVAPPYPVLSREQLIEGMVVKTGTDVMQPRIQAMTRIFEAQAQALSRYQAAQSNPKLQALAQGQWHLFSPNSPKKPGQGCANAFANQQGVVLLSAVPGYKEAVITFIGPEIPKPSVDRKTKATIDQFDGPAATITVLNHSLGEGERLGAITMEVPTMDLLLGTMVEKQPFEITMEGKPVIKIEWHGGIAARDQLRNCIRSR